MFFYYKECHRCGAEFEEEGIASYFNEDLICKRCSQAEKELKSNLCEVGVDIENLEKSNVSIKELEKILNDKKRDIN